jgi:Tfp pilus assembly protein PilP
MRTFTFIAALTIAWSLGLCADLRAQTTPGASAPAEGRAAYDPDGRRDPFTSLERSGPAITSSNRPVGVRGLLISELSLRGVVQSRQRLLATVEGPDKRTYTISNGDALLDGTVKVVTADAVVFLQQVTDPLSPIKQREIRKTLRPTEENR